MLYNTKNILGLFQQQIMYDVLQNNLGEEWLAALYKNMTHMLLHITNAVRT